MEGEEILHHLCRTALALVDIVLLPSGLRCELSFRREANMRGAKYFSWVTKRT